MRTTYTLDNPKVKLARQVESTKAKINKYIKRERNKTLPEGTDFWDFLCKFGPSKDEATKVHLAEINKHIDEYEAKEITTFYIEIVAKAATRTEKSQ